MNETTVLALAKYLTGGDVGLHSVGLNLPEPLRSQALRFFDLRSTFGVDGYMDAETAKVQIIAALSN